MRIRANWWLDPTSVKRCLLIKKKLQREDSQTLKEYPFGELAYDYEEGLIWWTDEKKLAKLVQFIKDFNKQFHAELEEDGMANFEVKACDSRDWDAFKPIAEKAGLTMSKEYTFVAELR